MIQNTDTTTGAAAAAVASPSGRAKLCASKRAKSKAPGAAPPGKGPPTLTPEALGAGQCAALSASDGDFLAEQEAIIERGLRDFVSVGRALLAIREHRKGVLWKARYGTFESYCRVRWGFEPQHGHRLMDAAEVAGQIDSSPIGDGLPGPSCEGHLRPVAKLKRAEDRCAAWRRSCEMAGGEPVAARHVEQVVRTMLKEGAEPRSARATRPRRERKPAKAPRPGGAIADGATLRPERDGGDAAPETAETANPTPEQPGPGAEAHFMDLLDQLGRVMAMLRDPDVPMSDKCMKEAQAFGRLYRGFLEDVAGCARAKARDGRRGESPLEDVPANGAEKGATP